MSFHNYENVQEQLAYLGQFRFYACHFKIPFLRFEFLIILYFANPIPYVSSIIQQTTYKIGKPLKDTAHLYQQQSSSISISDIFIEKVFRRSLVRGSEKR